MKKMIFLVVTFLTFAYAGAQEVANGGNEKDSIKGESLTRDTQANVVEKRVYSLEECRQMALDNNKANQKAQVESEKAALNRKSARTKYFPDLSIKGAYVRSGEEMSLIPEDMYLPIGVRDASGNFGFNLPTPQMVDGQLVIKSDQIANQWAMYNGQVLPLDANGKPFDPRKNPEKIQWNQYTTIPKDELTFDTRNLFLLSLNLVQPVYMGGKIVAYNRICKLQKELADSKLNTLQEEILVDVDEAYWQIVSLNSKKKAVEGLLSLLDKMEKDVNSLITSGMATKADELTVSVKKNEAEMAMFKVENGIHLSKMLLAQYCGLPLNESYDLQDEGIESIEVSATQPADMEEVYGRRNEIKSLTIAESLYEQKEKIELSKLLPNVALFGTYAGTSPNLKSGFDTKMNFDWHVGVMVNIPLLHWGENIYTLKAAKCETKIARLSEEEAREKIELQVTQSQFNHDEALRKLEISSTSLSKAEENLKHATIGFQEGVIPASNLIEAQTAWLSAKSDKIEAEIEAKVSEINYKKATGTLVEK